MNKALERPAYISQQKAEKTFKVVFYVPLLIEDGEEVPDQYFKTEEEALHFIVNQKLDTYPRSQRVSLVVYNEKFV